jgi:D-tagatose-bisphosphate aldolase class II non-catalytic subunit
LVGDGFAILKVGPGLTFALREALYALDQIAGALDPGWREHSLMAEMESEMLADPQYWQSYYHGGANRQRILRHFSYSDRIRYYWAAAGSQRAVQHLMDKLDGTSIPEPLISQFLPTLHQRVASGAVDPTPKAMVIEAVRDVLRIYSTACGSSQALG